MVAFTSADINQILHKHNNLRNNVAAGRNTGFQNAQLPQATRMARTRWNDELAQIAALNTRQCRMAHDTCRATSKKIRI